MNFMKDLDEQWKEIIGFEGLYEVSNHGRVRSLAKNHYKARETKIMAVHKDNGYYSVWLRKPGGIHKKCRIHRVVAVAFLESPTAAITDLVVNHKDRDRTNNHVSNLEWATYSENANHYIEDDKVKAGNQKIMTAADIPF